MNLLGRASKGGPRYMDPRVASTTTGPSTRRAPRAAAFRSARSTAAFRFPAARRFDSVEPSGSSIVYRQRAIACATSPPGGMKVLDGPAQPTRSSMPRGLGGRMTDFTELKQKHKAMWALGEYDVVAQGLHSAQDHVIRVAMPRPGERVLDVATGTGNTALKARAMGASVTGFDLAPELLAVARKKAEGMGYKDVQWDEGDAAKLPYRDDEFDVVLSTCGHMFAPDQAQVGAEIVRVTRPGGRIVFMAWTAQGGVGRLFQVMGKHAPPPPGVPPTFNWGDKAHVERLLPGVTDLRFETGDCVESYPDAQSITQAYSTKYGPTVRALASLEGEKRQALQRDLLAFYEGYVTPIDGKARWGREYLLTRATKR